MRSTAEKLELCVQFARQHMPHWVFHPDVVQALQLHEIRFVPEAQMNGNRGYAIEHKVRVSAVTSKWRHASPYTAPCGKADLSPVGVMVHEIGHILEFASWRTKAKEIMQYEWQDLHRQQRGKAITSYAKSHWREDLAESHRLYVLNPKLLKELSPDRYDAIHRLYEAVTGSHKPRREFKLTVPQFKEQWAKLVH
jgi:hypothetical protein